jgi:hypothetical protein
MVSSLRDGRPDGAAGNPPERPAAPAVPATGELLIDATPWAEVLSVTPATGSAMSLPSDRVTPLVLSLEAGRYTIVLRDAAGATKTVESNVATGRQSEALARFTSVTAAEYLRRAGQ